MNRDPHARETGDRRWISPLIAAGVALAIAPTFAMTDEIGRWTIALGIATNLPCAVLGCYLVLRRMSLLGDAISHAVLPGIALGFLIGVRFAGEGQARLGGPGVVVGAMAVGMLTAFLTHALSRLGKVPEDASMGVVFTSLFAIGVILITRAARDVDLDPGCVLYGLIEMEALDTVQVLGVEVPRSLGSLGLAGVLTAGFVGLLWKELKLVSFDPGLATAVGINAAVVHYALMAMVAGATVAAFEAVGSILVVAMLIVPAATAHLLTDRLGRMMLVASGVAVLSAGYGYLGAVRLNTSVAGMMSVVAGLLFAAAVVLGPRHGLLGKLLRTLGLSLRIVREDLLARLYRAEESNAAPVASGHGGPIAALAGWQLRRRGLIETGRDAPGLTAAGRHEAGRLVRAHRLWESYLSANFDLPADHLHEPAERVEHYLGPALVDDLSTELDRPTSDPHGRSIPPGEPGRS